MAALGGLVIALAGTSIPAEAEAAQSTFAVADGYDSKSGKTLVQDGKLYVVQSVDGNHHQVESGRWLSLRFAGSVPAGATIRSVKVGITRYEESGIAANSILWQVGGGSLTSPTSALSFQPARVIGPENKALTEWDVMGPIDTVAEVNGLRFVVRNQGTSGKKGLVDRVYLTVNYDVVPTAPSITSSAPTTATVGQPYTYQPQATGTTPITWSLLSGPAFMTVNPGTGLVSWAPVDGSFTVTIRAINSVGPVTQSWTITASTPPSIASSPSPSATVGQPYTYQAQATGTPQITWSVVSGPSGMSVTSGGLVSWTPAAAGSFAVSIRASNGVTPAATQIFTIVVTAVPTAPSITSSAPTTATVNQAYSYDAEATGTGPISWALDSGPGGMVVNATTGLVSWTPPATGSFPVTIRATGAVAPPATQSWTITASTAPPPPASATIFAAGDVADCNSSGDEQTAALLDQPANAGGTVLGLGDLAYENGSASEFANCYEPTWGRHKARTSPAPGNHEYQTSGATGYYNYFGAAAGPLNRGYYSFDLGPWHVVSLNSEVAFGAGSAQTQWLTADLAAASAPCVLAFLHKPRFTAGNYTDFTTMTPLWNVLYAANAEVVLSGHDHIYERYRPMTPAGASDPARGLRQFVVGTGGRGHYALGSDSRREAGHTGTFGVLKMTLRATGYDWQFLPVAGASYTDSGSTSCH